MSISSRLRSLSPAARNAAGFSSSALLPALLLMALVALPTAAAAAASAAPRPQPHCHRGMVIISHGQLRTASTYQFTLACLIARVCAARENSTAVRCFPGLDDRTLNTYARVIKTHGPTQIPRGAYVFHMLRSRNDSFDGEPADYTANLEELSKVGFQKEVHDVARLFALTHEEERLVSHYMKWWTVLRQCCGLQSSVDHRMKMHNFTDYEQHHAPFDPTAPSCELYNLTAVEKEVLRHPLARGFLNVVSYGMKAADPPIHPGICAESDEKLRSGIDINGKVWDPAGRKP